MAACWRCGTSTPSGANFCPACGAEIRGELPELDLLVEPAGGDAELVEADDTADPRWLILVAVVVIGGFVGFFAFLGGDEPAASDDETAELDAEEDTSPDTSTPDGDEDEAESEVGTVTNPAPLEWSQPFEGDGFPIGLVEIGDVLFLYAADSRSGYSGGLRSYVFQRGSDGAWTEVGPMVDPDAMVNTVAATDGGAIATGTDGDGRPTVWRSADGREWVAETLPDPEGDAASDAVPHLVAASGDATVVLGRSLDPYLRLLDVIRERFGDLTGAFPDFGEDGTAVVRGPFGAVLAEIELTELGLDPDLVDDFFSEDQQTTMWEHDGTTWSTTGLDGFPLDLFVLENGQIVRNIGTDRPAVSFRGPDGWSDAIDVDLQGYVHPWGNRLVGPDERDGLVVVGPGPDDTDQLVVPGSSGFMTALATRGDALGFVRFEFDSTSEPFEPTETFVVLRDGFSLTAEFGTLILERDGERLFRGALDWDQVRDRHRTDTIDGELTVVFVDEEGNDLVGFTVDELADLQAAVEPVSSNGLRRSVWFTPDGARWFGGATDDELAGIGAAELHVGDETITMAASHTPGGFRPGGPLRFRVFDAALPQ